MGIFFECFCGKFSWLSLNVCVDHSLKITKKSYRPVDLWSPYFNPSLPIHADHLYFYPCQVISCFLWKNVEHVNYRHIMKNLPRTFPKGWNCPNLVGTFCKRYVLGGKLRLSVTDWANWANWPKTGSTHVTGQIFSRSIQQVNLVQAQHNLAPVHISGIWFGQLCWITLTKMDVPVYLFCTIKCLPHMSLEMVNKCWY